MADKVCRLMRHKTLPVQVQCMQLQLTARRRALDLVKALIRMAPERRRPALIQPFDRTIALLQPLLKRLLAQRTVTLTAILIRDMPQNHTRMTAQPFRQLPIDQRHLLSIDRRRVAVIVPSAEQIPMAGFIDPQHLRILVCQPFRTRAGRCRQNRGNPVLIEVLDDLLQPLKVEYPFLRLQRRP